MAAPVSTFAEILQKVDADRRRKIARKLPLWDDAGLMFPSDLALEQCSSQRTAEYKASVAVSCPGVRGGVVTDITGGLGVDSLAFSSVASQVHYVERNEELVRAARHNLPLLGAGNVDFLCAEVDAGTVLPASSLIYADPARRDRAGRKVFLLEDCSPDVLTLLPMLFSCAPHVLLKLSPMADISMLASRLGPELKEVHIVESGGEVKELLCLLCKGWSGGYEVIVASSAPMMRFRPEDELSAPVRLANAVSAGDELLVPSAGLLKSGAFKLVCSRFGLAALDRSTHLYVQEESSGNLAEHGLFTRFTIMEVAAFGKASLKSIGTKYGKAEVTARNIRMGSEELRRRLGVSPGGDVHIFGCSTACCGTLLIVAA